MTKEELEKENRLLGERCNQLLKDKGELTDKIEKMKCCENCKHLNSLAYGEFSCDLYGECKHCSEWEIKEND